MSPNATCRRERAFPCWVSAWAWTQAAATTAFMLGVWESLTLALLMFVGIQFAATAMWWRSRTIDRHDDVRAVAVSAGMSFCMLWIVMCLTTLRYEDVSRSQQMEWIVDFTPNSAVIQFGTAPVPRSRAGFPFWGVGGSSGQGSDIYVPIDGAYDPKGVVYGGRANHPKHIRQDRGLACLYANWAITWLALAGVVLLCPRQWSSGLEPVSLLLAWLGCVIAFAWVFRHGYD